MGRSDCRPIVRLSADTIVRWDYRPNPNLQLCDGQWLLVPDAAQATVSLLLGDRSDGWTVVCVRRLKKNTQHVLSLIYSIFWESDQMC